VIRPPSGHYTSENRGSGPHQHILLGRKSALARYGTHGAPPMTSNSFLIPF
jgi:hypothetical protein